jgi:hypothetical protein
MNLALEGTLDIGADCINSESYPYKLIMFSSFETIWTLGGDSGDPSN